MGAVVARFYGLKSNLSSSTVVIIVFVVPAILARLTRPTGLKRDLLLAKQKFTTALELGSSGSLNQLLQAERYSGKIDAETHLSMARAIRSWRAGHLDETIRELQTVIQKSPQYARAHAFLAAAYALCGRAEEDGVPEIDKAILSDPKFAPGHYLRGLAYLDAGQFTRAAVEFQETIQLDPLFWLAKKELDKINQSSK